MFVVTNMQAGGGRGKRRWERLLPLLVRERADIRRCELDDPLLAEHLDRALRTGEQDIVAAGGDGTVNAVVNALMTLPDADLRARARLGAVGLGSSNDFHKPLRGRPLMQGFPTALGFDRAAPRDVGRVRLLTGTEHTERHFIVNASVGLTALANRIFLHGGPQLRITRAWSTAAAIGLAAAGALATYRPSACILTGPSAPGGRVDLATLSILKSPHVSGGFRFPFTPVYDDGLFRIALTAGHSRLQVLRLAALLRQGRRPPPGVCTTWEAASVGISSDTPFAVELDGEVTTAREAVFEVIPRALRVCP